jgi:hypothetical protein
MSASTKDPSTAAERPAAHDRRIVVWDVPTAVAASATFRVKVGVKCALECRAGRWLVEIRNHEGHALATGAVSEVPWPDTAALHYVDLALQAPATEGLQTWEARVPASDADTDGSAHAAASERFTVRTVPRPECRLKVIAVDARNHAPVAGAHVVAHPYRASADALGVAEIDLPKGVYRLFVSRRGYLPFRFDGEVAADTTIEAELIADVGPSPAELWP